MLAAYGIPAIENVLAADPAAAAQAAVRLGFPVALTYASPDVPRKWDVGGVALNLQSAEAVRVAAEAMLAGNAAAPLFVRASELGAGITGGPAAEERRPGCWLRLA